MRKGYKWIMYEAEMSPAGFPVFKGHSQISVYVSLRVCFFLCGLTF
jgi:hypothetical protein